MQPDYVIFLTGLKIGTTQSEYTLKGLMLKLDKIAEFTINLDFNLNIDWLLVYTVLLYFSHISVVTLNNGQQDNNDKEEEGDVKQNSVDFRGVSVGRFNLITWSGGKKNSGSYDLLSYCCVESCPLNKAMLSEIFQ